MALFDLESVAIDLSEDLPLEPTQEDFADVFAAGMADGTIVASEEDSGFEDDEELDSIGTSEYAAFHINI